MLSASRGHSRLFAILAVVFCACLTAPPTLARATALDDYVAAPDDTFAWKLIEKKDIPATPPYVRYTIGLTSQTWHGFTWTHNVLVFVPAVYEHPETMMLVIGGGQNAAENGPAQGVSTTEALVLPQIATRSRAIVALLSQVPNQPILGGLNEDQAIAHTFSKYLETADPTWPLLLPMTKSAVRTMDALQAFGRQELGIEVQKFMVTGASKRGWTTWLTAAVDPRVSAIAPIVIDNLNMAAQMPHQIESWGAYSDSIKDYTELELPQQMGQAGERGEALLQLIDPYFYRDRLTMPKLVQNGTNDPYWVLDASKFYFPDLLGEKYLHFSPNTAHDIDLSGIMSIGGFFHFVRTNQNRPKFTWEVAEETENETLTITHNDLPTRVMLWTADAPTRDFRQALWTSTEVPHGEGQSYLATVPRPETGFRAYYGELVYTVENGVTMGLCTEMRVVGSQGE